MPGQKYATASNPSVGVDNRSDWCPLRCNLLDWWRHVALPVEPVSLHGGLRSADPTLHHLFLSVFHHQEVF